MGIYGKTFHLYKFKTMTGTNKLDKGIATLSKSRITSFGSILRKTHLDELPQFFMVLLGSMSLVGPRPEVSSIINSLNDKDCLTFTSIRPGLISPASLKYIKEDEILELSGDPEEFYMNKIMPDKIRMNREYLTEVSFMNDFKILTKYLMLVVRRK
jgi:lipopolysaccharide/colanic/teichoic acid biosynthesis glycosyltransferase